MKQIRIAILALILTALACAKQPVEPSPAPTAEAVKTPAATETPVEPEPLRTLLYWNGSRLVGSLDAAFGGGYRVLQLHGTNGAENASGASVSFLMNRANGDGERQASGMLFFGKDASALFDTDEAPDGKAANALLSKLCGERLAEAGASAVTEEFNGIKWNYGFAEEKRGDGAMLDLIAWAEPEQGLLYVTVTVSDTGGLSTDETKDLLRTWLSRLTFAQAADRTESTIKAPLGEHTLCAADWDLFGKGFTALSWNAANGCFSGSVSGVDGKTAFTGTLQNAAVAGEDAIAEAQTVVQTALESPLNWRYVISDGTLTAVGSSDGETLLFELALDSEGEDTAASDLLTRALEWLKTVTVA